MRLRLRSSAPLAATAAIFMALFGGAATAFEGFGSTFVLADLLTENAFLGVAALGMTLVIISGGIDLSVGSVIGFTSIFVASLITDHGLPPLVAWAMALVAGTVFGAVMGLVIARFKLPPFLATLCGLFFARGMAFVVRNESVRIDHPFYDTLGDVGVPLGGGAELTLSAMIFLGLFLVVLLVSRVTRFGRNLYAIGGDEDSALLMGLPVTRTKVAVYAFNGFCSALAGIVLTLYTDSGNPTSATAVELDAIAAVVIGGTLLSGGVGFVTGTLLGVLIYGTIYQITYFANLPASLGSITIGGLLLAFIVLQKWLGRAPAD
ncbi:MAG: galactofuranose ABC transporter, permease protein YjfF [Planctomycetota bacterium]